MDFSLNEEQRRMQETVGDLLEDEGGIELARAQIAGDDVVDDLWETLAGVDYTAMTVPVEYGGLGDGLLNLSLFLEEAGRVAMPGPVPETLGFAVPLIAELGTEAQKDAYLPGVADGSLRFGVALHDDRTETPPETVQMDAERTADGFRLDGTKTLVPYAESVDHLVVAAASQDDSGYGGISLFVVDADQVDAEPLESLDATRPLHRVTFDAVEVGEDALLGPLHGGGEALKRGIDRLSVATSAMLVGGADAAVDRSTQHANERTQFGHPIGRFQAVKHRIADMWMEMQGARSLVWYAAWALDNDASDAPAAVARAASFTADRCTDIFGSDVLNHGGMGFTWENDAHIFLKQARAWEAYFGTPQERRERIADARL
jgi:alkylation response protein AidB-like acyl-CoA dehydrogenase